MAKGPMAATAAYLLLATRSLAASALPVDGLTTESAQLEMESAQLEMATRRLQEKRQRFQQNLQESWKPSVPQNLQQSWNPSVPQPFSDLQSEAWRVPQLSRDLQLASERLALQQRLASAQLARAGLEAREILGGMGRAAAQRALRRGAGLAPGLVEAAPRAGPGEASSKGTKEVAALPQTVSRVRNPAAALLLEPVLSVLSVLGWAAVVLCGAATAACGVHLGKARFAGSPPRPGAAEGAPRSAADFGGPARSPGGYFRYPGSLLHQPGGRGAGPTASQAVEEDEEGVEAWVKVPAAGRGNEGRQACNTWPGYLDDEDDCSDVAASPSPGQYHPRGYLDER